jgi:hypothetical protein
MKDAGRDVGKSQMTRFHHVWEIRKPKTKNRPKHDYGVELGVSEGTKSHF